MSNTNLFSLKNIVILFGVICIVALFVTNFFFSDSQPDSELKTVAPSFEGEIANCGESFGCYSDLITATIAKEGLAAGFIKTKNLYQTVPSLRSNCSFLASTVAKQVATDYPDYTKLELTPESAWCNFGFLQAYPRAIMESTGDNGLAGSYCTYVGQSIGEDVPGAEAECFRGIGNGLISIWLGPGENHEELAATGIAECKRLTLNEKNYDACASGVFNELGFLPPRDVSNPMALCSAQETEELSRMCYGNYKRAALNAVGSEAYENFPVALTKLKEFFKDSTIDPSRELVYNHGYRWAEAELVIEKDVMAGTSECLRLPSEVQQYCVQGMSTGIVKNGDPESQYKLLTEYCVTARNEIPEITHEDCPYIASIEYLHDFYSEEEFAVIMDYMKSTLTEIRAYSSEE